MYQIFDRNDIENLKIIKKLIANGGMSTKEAKEYMEQHKDEVILKRETNISDKSLVALFVEFLNTQNEKINYIAETQETVLQHNQQMLESQESFKEMLIDLHKEISTYNQNNQKSIEDMNSQREKELKEKKKETKAVNALKKEVKNLNDIATKEIEEVKNINNQTMKEIEEIKASNKDNEEKSTEMINLMKQSMEERERELQKKQEEKSKGFMSKLFGK